MLQLVFRTIYVSSIPQYSFGMTQLHTDNDSLWRALWNDEDWWSGAVSDRVRCVIWGSRIDVSSWWDATIDTRGSNLSTPASLKSMTVLSSDIVTSEAIFSCGISAAGWEHLLWLDSQPSAIHAALNLLSRAIRVLPLAYWGVHYNLWLTNTTF